MCKLDSGPFWPDLPSWTPSLSEAISPEGDFTPPIVFAAFSHCYRIVARIVAVDPHDLTLRLEDGILAITAERTMAASEDRDDVWGQSPPRIHVALPDDADPAALTTIARGNTLVVMVGRKGDKLVR